MPVERRLRGGLERKAGVVAPDVEASLDAVVRRARPRVIMRRAAMGLAVAAALAVVVAAGPWALHTFQSLHRSAPSAHRSHKVVPPPLAGTFTRTRAPATPPPQPHPMAARGPV